MPIDAECKEISKKAVKMLATERLRNMYRVRVRATVAMVNITRDLKQNPLSKVRHDLVNDILTKLINQIMAQAD